MAGREGGFRVCLIGLWGYLGMYVLYNTRLIMHEGFVGSDDWSILQERASSKVDDIFNRDIALPGKA